MFFYLKYILSFFLPFCLSFLFIAHVQATSEKLYDVVEEIKSIDENKIPLYLFHRYRYEIINGVVVFNPGECAGIMKGKNAIGIVNLKTLSFERIFF